MILPASHRGLLSGSDLSETGGGILLIIFTLFLCSSACAVSIEDESLRILPREIEGAVRSSGISYDMIDCKLVGVPLILSGDKPRSAYFVTVEGKCLGNSAGRIFIVDVSESKPAVIMKSAAYSVQSGKEKHNGLNDLRIFMGNAGHAIIEYWIFNSKEFVRDEERSWIFWADCREQSKNPENPFDCNGVNKKVNE